MQNDQLANLRLVFNNQNFDVFNFYLPSVVFNISALCATAHDQPDTATLPNLELSFHRESLRREHDRHGVSWLGHTKGYQNLPVIYCSVFYSLGVQTHTKSHPTPCCFARDLEIPRAWTAKDY